MQIVTKSRIINFYKEYPDAKTALEVFISRIKELEIKNLNDVKQIYNTADIIGNNRVIFNIKGNNYRIITVVLVRNQTVYIRWIGTHAAYDKINAHTI